MRGKNPVSDVEMTGGIDGALDDLERIETLIKGVIIVLDDMRCRIIVRQDGPAPKPWDDEHPGN
jgi:hypothetical protein